MPTHAAKRGRGSGVGDVILPRIGRCGHHHPRGPRKHHHRKAGAHAHRLSVEFHRFGTFHHDFHGGCAVDFHGRIVADRDGAPPSEVRPADGGHWTRRMVADWMETWIKDGPPALFGIDHGLGFPVAWWGEGGGGWDALLDRFVARFPADIPGATVRALRAGAGAWGDARWRRECDRAAGAKSIFHFDVPGSVATSTHAGLAFVHRLRARHRDRLHVWPFDGAIPPANRHVKF